jgi:general secretion pathway protein D
VSLVASACALPLEQLSLPSPIGPPGGEGGASATGKKSVPLGDPGAAQADQPRAYEGSGKFTNDAGAGPSKAFSAATGEGVTLDLVGASIPEAAKAVLGDVLNVTYIVSDKVKGSITLKTSKPVSKDGLVDIFESVLDTQDAAILVQGPIYKIVPRDEAIASGKPMVTRGSGAPRGPGISSEIVPLKYVAAAEMQRILNSVAPQSTVARVDSARNLLVLTGTKVELASMVETIATFDVDWMRGMSFGIFPVETTDTEALAQELDTIFANDQEGPTKGIVRFVPNARLKAILVITSRPAYLQKAETWIKRIDMAGQATEKRAFVYHVQYRPVQEIAAVLQKIYGARALQRPGDTQREGAAPAGPTNEFPASIEEPVPPMGQSSQAAGAAGGSPLPPQAFDPARLAAATAAGTAPTTGAAPEGVAGALPSEEGVRSGMLAKPPPDDRNSGIQIVADEANNSLVISATPGEIKRIRQVLSQIDTVPSQVLLEATIAEVTLNDNLKFGLRWFFEKGASTAKLTDSVVGAIAPVFPGFSYFLNTPNAQVVLNALADVTNVDVISSPSLMVLNNKKAILQIGDEVPIATQSAVSVTTGVGPAVSPFIVNAIAFRNTGVILAITPRVSEDGRVLLEIEQEVSDVKATTSSSIDSPTIAQRRIKTTVVVNNGGSVVLAGLMQDRSTRQRQQVPLVGDIPLFGNLFKNKDDKIARTELLIAITPQVVVDNTQVGMIAAEFRDRMNFTTRPQRQTPPDRKEQLDRLVR